MTADIRIRLAAAALTVAAMVAVFGSIDRLASSTLASPMWAAAVGGVRA